MSILASSGTFPDDDNYLWLAIRQFSTGQTHCGLVYRKTESEVRLLHLRSHYDLADEEFDPSYRWVASGLDAVNQLVMAAFAIAVADSLPNLAYGFDAEGIALDPTTGKLIEAPLGKGMTCATFVRALFLHQAIDILQLETWPERPEDEIWRQSILSYFEQNNIDPSHVDAVRNCHAARRCKPEDILAAGTADLSDMPVEFAYANSIAVQILSEL